MEWRISQFQEKVLAIPEEYCIFLGGGRGGAKSYLMALMAIDHLEKYRRDARVLYIRKSYSSMRDFEGLILDLLYDMKGMGREFVYNKQDKVFTFDHRGKMDLGQLDKLDDYSKYQGRSFTLIMIDEAGEYESLDIVDKLRSNMRSPNVTPRMIWAANPGGAGHHTLYRRFVSGRTPWRPFREEATVVSGFKTSSPVEWIYCPSTYKDNPFIDHERYLADLLASAPHDPEIVKAWVSGDWDINRGAFFANVLDMDRNCVPDWPLPEKGQSLQQWAPEWKFWLTHDYGTAAPSATYVWALSPGGYDPTGERYYPRDSIVLLDEDVTAVSGSPNDGLNLPIHELARRIQIMAERWGIPCKGPADDQIFAELGVESGSIAKEFRKNKVYFQPAKKGKRVEGWQIVRQLLHDAGKFDRNGAILEKPGLYITQSCKYFWDTVPFLGRDARNPEDLNSRQPDHAADAIRYACTWARGPQQIVVGDFWSVFPSR